MKFGFNLFKIKILESCNVRPFYLLYLMPHCSKTHIAEGELFALASNIRLGITLSRVQGKFAFSTLNYSRDLHCKTFLPLFLMPQYSYSLYTECELLALSYNIRLGIAFSPLKQSLFLSTCKKI
jgi:hypothetical protein